jgi:hypothetical protein
MATPATIQIAIVSGGGPITSDVYKAYYSDGTAGSEDWKKGEPLYLDGGVLKRIGTSGTASADSVNTDDTGFGAAARRFIALADHDSSAVGKSDFVSVQEITPESVVRVQVAASSATSPTIANLKTTLATYDPASFYKSAADVWGIDVDENEDKGVFNIKKFDTDINPHKPDAAGLFVEGTFSRSLFI